MINPLLPLALYLLAPLSFALADGPANIDALAKTVLAGGKAPGFALAIQKDGKPYFARGYGLAEAGKRTAVTAETRFAIGSISKQFAAVAILQLAEQGKLRLEDTLGRYLPTLPNANRITLRMLLNQTSGLHNYPNTQEHDWPRKGAIAPARLAAILATDQPDFDPGTRFAYSNTNYFALAAVVEKVSGLGYGDYLDRNIFLPLGMTSSGNGFSAQHDLAIASGGQGDPHNPLSLDLFLGAGSVVSTAADLARWDQALLDGKLLKPASMQLLWTPGKPAQGSSAYAMGFVAASLEGRRELWHNGLTPTAGGYNLNAIFPDDRLAIVVLSNGADFQPEPENLVRGIVNTLLGTASEIQAQAATPPTPAPAPVENPAVTAMALKIYAQMRAGKVDDALLTKQMQAAATPELLAQNKPMFDTLGDPKELKLEAVAKLGDGTNYTYLAIFPTAQFHISILITAEGKVGGYFLKP